LVIVPTLVTLSYRSDYPPKKYWLSIVVLATVFIWIPFYGSGLVSSKSYFGSYYVFFNVTFLLAFIALFFLKSIMREQQWLPSYESLFGFSWHIFLSFSLAWLFTFIFWLILVLWGTLFGIVNINFFKQLFEKEWFLFPVLSLAFAYAVIIFRTKINAIGAVQRILRALISILLPLLLAIAVMFVGVLPFTGVELIWDKGYGSDTIIGFVALSLFFFNAVYQDAKEPAYGAVLNKIVQYAVIVLIGLLAISAYGISLRIAQYGLTHERILVVILLTIMFCYIAAYAVIILFKSATWSEYFGKTNTVMALIICLVIVAMFTPLLNLSRMSVNSQLERLEQGKVTIEKFDYFFLARNGPVGLKALNDLKEREDVSASEDLVTKIDKAIKSKGRYYAPENELNKTEVRSVIKSFPEGVEVETEFWTYLTENYYQTRNCLNQTCALLSVDMNGDEQNEHILYIGDEKRVRYQFFIKNEGSGYNSPYSYSSKEIDIVTIINALESGTYSLQPPQWQDLNIGDTLFRMPNQQTN